MYIIYKYTSPSKRNYIGLTKNEPVRTSAHRQKEYNNADKSHFANAIRKYGYENFEYVIIDRAETVEEASAKEIHYIQFYDSVNSGYNIELGGTHAPKYRHEERVVEDIQYLLKNTELTIYKIATKIEVSVSYVSNIKNAKMRSSVPIVRSNKSRKGSTNGKSKLTEGQTKEIREKLQAGAKRRDLQKEYGVSKTLIQLIATNQAWSHVEANYEYKKKETNGNAVLNEEIVRQLKLELASGLSALSAAEKFKISVATVYQIKQGKTWKDVV